MNYYNNAKDALAHAAQTAPACVGYAQGNGWMTYNPVDGCPIGCVPEFFVAKRGTHPLPLSELATEVWLSMLQSLTTKRTKRP